MKHKLQQKMINILARCMDMTIATTRSDGSPQATVVSFVHDGLLLYFGCGAGSQKAMNISRDPRVSVAMTAPYANWLEIQGLSMAATATEVVLPSELTEIGRMMVQRFPQISVIQPSEATPVKLFRVRPTIISVLDYSLGFGHTDLVKIEADDIAETLDSMRHHWLVGTSATS
ncbi:MAG: pyridoxamine 5'-phosphate oxidase [Mesorhizobium sp.]|nr:MAG: pyridoxamine 5'-phosphate oxidase [Mesorhizobium sp.]TIO32791.1 MAG: pyridoxamine 5'-phosphate oxidase [Mesorhizobium sp.]TIP13966.1 MAG: pyridoxamine 5'-phosphate oxidase [Mesorhizobium sp.]TIP14852.1 MAG: pyridoxamine 5'-phosphate oxidase [Mesorhizobium sp.]